MFDPSKPNDTLLAFAKVNALTFELVVPPDTLMLVSEVATDAVIVLPLNPKLTP